MKYIPGYLDSFISPITGKIISNTVLPLSYNYILIGDRDGNSIEGPALIDVWLDIRNIKEKLSSTTFIIQTASPDFINAQALDQIDNGMISNLNGIIVPTTLTQNYIWIGDVTNRPFPTQRIGLINAPPFLSALLVDPTSLPPGAPVNFGYNNIY